MKFGRSIWFVYFVVAGTAIARADLLVSDNFGSQVLRYNQNTGAYLATVVPFGSGGLDGAIGMRLDANGDLLVSSQNTQAILRYDLYSGAYLGPFASNATTPGANLSQPAGLVWGPDGNLYVANFAGNSVDRFTPGGVSLGKFATGTAPNFVLGTASGIFGPDGNLYVSTFNYNRVYVFQGPAGAHPGAFLSVFATTTTQNGMSGPADMLFDSSGNLYVASLLSHAVLEFSVNTTTVGGVVTSVTGTYMRKFATGSNSFPSSMLFAADGSLLVSETGGAAVYRFDVSNANFGAPLGEFTSGGNPSSPVQVPGEMLYVPNANQWAGPEGGTWAATTNWTTGTVPNSNNDAALMWDNLTAAGAINLGGTSRTVQRIDFDTHSGSFAYDVQNGLLILDGGSTGNARISAQSTNANNQTISANIQYNTATVITNSSQNGSLVIFSGQQDWNGKAVTVMSGSVKFNTSANAIDTAGASLSITGGATVELAGTASSTSDGTIGVAITNAGTLNVTGKNQCAANISGSGTTNVGTSSGNNSSLASNRIVQSALNIGRAPTTANPTPGIGTVTINATSPSAYISPGDTTVPAGSNAGTSILSSLSIANDGSGLAAVPGTGATASVYYGTLDLQNNNLVIDYTGTTNPVDSVRGAIQAAFHGGGWDGKGLTSSLIADNPSAQYALGYSDNADPNNQFAPFTSLEGTTVGSHSILVKFTWQDDLNLDGTVDINDASIFANTYDNGATTGHTFATADLNYDGVVDINDASIFANSYIVSPPLATLPEPSSFVLAGLGLAGLLAARRRMTKLTIASR